MENFQTGCIKIMCKFLNIGSFVGVSVPKSTESLMLTVLKSILMKLYRLQNKCRKDLLPQQTFVNATIKGSSWHNQFEDVTHGAEILEAVRHCDDVDVLAAVLGRQCSHVLYTNHLRKGWIKARPG